MNYITFDFETANNNLTSACSIGIVVVEDNLIREKYHYLINPLEEFSERNISIHNIKQIDVVNEQNFQELWPKIKNLFENNIVYAHNASFDMAILKALIDKYELGEVKIRFGCTLKIAKKLWKDELPNLKLGTISRFLEIEHTHHNALSDALVCVSIINRGIKVMRVDLDTELYEILGIRYGEYSKGKLYNSVNKYPIKPIKINNELLNEKIIYLAGKPSKLTKKELMNKLINNGVYLEKNISLSLDYFVTLGNVPKASLKRLTELNSKGHNIEVINEDALLGLIK